MFKCKICNDKYTTIEGLYEHIEEEHEEMIPKDMSVQQYYYFMKTGKINGNCVMCKGATSWNPANNKYNRFCSNPKCKEKYVEMFRERMIGKHGKVHLLNDPEQQKKMLANRSISGEYKWSDNKTVTAYTGSYELDFLKTMDFFFDWDPSDIIMPAPQVFYYKYDNEEKFYIPDVFIPSLNLLIEIKDGGKNPNNHHKIQAVDKIKEKNKDEVLKSQKSFHYIKILDKNYANFFKFLNNMKVEFEKYGNMDKIPRMFILDDINDKKFEGKELIKENAVEEIIENQEDEVVNEATISFSFINNLIRTKQEKYDSGIYIKDLDRFKRSYQNLINNASTEAELIIIKKDIANLVKFIENNIEMDYAKINTEVTKDLLFWISHDVKYLIEDRMKRLGVNNFIGDKPNKIGKNGIEIIVLFNRTKCRTGKAFTLFDKNTQVVINRRAVIDRQNGIHAFVPTQISHDSECMVYSIDGVVLPNERVEAVSNLKPIVQVFNINNVDNSLFIADIYHSITNKSVDPSNIKFIYSGTYKNYIKGDGK